MLWWASRRAGIRRDSGQVGHSSGWVVGYLRSRVKTRTLADGEDAARKFKILQIESEGWPTRRLALGNYSGSHSPEMLLRVTHREAMSVISHILKTLNDHDKVLSL